MCGRLDQSDIDRLLNNFAWADEVARRSSAELRFNAPPGTFRPVMHVEDGALVLDDVFWGYRPAWAAGKIPIAVNARMDKITGKYWKPLLSKGRAIVPAQGWYEWTGEKGAKQPWHIHRANGEGIYIATIGNFGPMVEHNAEAGFVLVTDDAHGGMVDVHDRRPVVLSAEDARRWLDPTLPWDEAEHLARTAALGPDQFAWYKVSTDVNRATTESAALAMPLAEA
jgi:putative SOS response-associated peptidase YedK